MNQQQKLLVQLLSCAIRGTTPMNLNLQHFNLKSLYEEAVSHAVDELLYPMVKSMSIVHPEAFTDLDTLAAWERSTLGSGMTQHQHIHRLGQVLTELNHAGIPVIALKGLVLREYYPKPELRNMGDADLLVHPSDLDKATSLLVSLGYDVDIVGDKHTTFTSSVYLPIELHKSLIENPKLKGAKEYQLHIWQNAIPRKVCGANALVLSPEDQLIHLCFHMAQHIISSGFGLRQLCDLVIFIEKNDQLDWEYFYSSIKSYAIHHFVVAVFLVCEKLFQLSIQKPTANADITMIGAEGHIDNDTFLNQGSTNSSEEYIYLLIEDILNGGTFGRKTADRAALGLQLHFSSAEKPNTHRKLRHYQSLVFPQAEKLGDRYTYARRHRYLLPIAWIHRVFFCIIRKDLPLKNKTTFIIPDNTMLNAFERRTKLLKWLELR